MSRLPGRIRLGGGLVVVVLAGAAVVAVTSARGADDAPAAEAAYETAEVVRRTLTSSETRDGAIDYADTAVLRAAVPGTLTGLRRVGATVRRGEVLYRVDQQPNVLLYGDIPAYRSLAVGSEGADVRQLEQNLRALGYRDFTVDNAYTSYTAEAVRSWQEDVGLEETGTVEHGSVSVAEGQVRMGAAVVDVGAPVQPGASVVEITGLDRAVVVSLEEADRELAKVADPVSVVAGTATAVGRVESVEAVATTGEDASTTTTYEVTITLAPREAKKLGGQPVGSSAEVAFDSATADDVLTVPVKALLALAEGGFGVQVVDGPGEERIVAVQTGMFADGDVEVSSDELAAGDQVVVAP